MVAFGDDGRHATAGEWPCVEDLASNMKGHFHFGIAWPVTRQLLICHDRICGMMRPAAFHIMGVVLVLLTA